MADRIHLKPFGLTSVLVDCPDLRTALAVHQQLKNQPPQGACEYVPAAQTVLVRFSTTGAAQEFRAHFQWHGSDEDSVGEAPEKVIDVVYDGDDLREVAELTGLSPDGVIHAHTHQEWRVAFAGFAPGFFYLHAEQNALAVPRRATPRTSVPSGAVGLAGNFSGVYPRTSPGGWQLIGRTAASLWDLDRNPPALLEPGDRVRFRAVRELIEVKDDGARQNRDSAGSEGFGQSQEHREASLTVVHPGAQLLVQDSGRFGLAHWGVSPSGFADEVAAGDANYAVGNPKDAPLLESLMGGFTLQAQKDTVVALNGAQAPATIAEPGKIDREVPYGAPFALLRGQKLSVGVAERGLRIYCAFRGGLDLPAEAGSVSSDTLSAIGTDPLAAGDILTLADRASYAVRPFEAGAQLPEPTQPTEIRVIAGPRDDWFTAASKDRLTNAVWQISAESNRIGARLQPVATETSATAEKILERSITEELPSEGMVTGAIQVPPSGEPVVFLADRPVTGGYPVIATVHPDDLRLIAQAAPGYQLRFTYSEIQEKTEGETRA